MRKKTDHLKLGEKGELAAKNYLISKGYKILETNYRFKKGEIDIIAFKEKFTVFVEVKTRSNISYGNPENAVDVKKENLIKSVAEAYMDANQIQGFIRFDIIAINVGGSSDIDIKHFEDAF